MLAAPLSAPRWRALAQRIAHTQTFRRGSQMPGANAVPNQTALHGAAEHGFDKYIKFLVANGADLTVKDANGRTPLDVARGAGGVRGGADAYPENRRTAGILDEGERDPSDRSAPARGKIDRSDIIPCMRKACVLALIRGMAAMAWDSEKIQEKDPEKFYSAIRENNLTN